KQIFSDGWVSGLVLANGVFVGNGAHGLIRSTDDGEQWECVLKDEGGFYRTSVIDGGFAAVRLAGIWRTSADNFPQRTFTSKDSGKTWKRLDKATIPIQAIRQLEQAEHFLFCSQKAGIFRSSDEGKSWNLIKSFKGIAEPMRLELSVSGNKIFVVKVFDGC
ncbi:MAG: sialidase family protein, partial [Saprospiraceae bacterium]